jgi:exoribonuclease-2
VPGTESLPRGSRVRARVTGIDLLTLELHASLAARLDEAAPTAADEDAAEDEAEPAGGLQIALTLDDAETAPAAAAPEGQPG